ncbi:hypothetical protein H0H81_005470, partial [Sphagnurus paluster]
MSTVKLFAKENSGHIKQKMAEEHTECKLTPKKSNLQLHHKYKNQLFNELDATTRLKYEGKAANLNACMARPPTRKD